MKKHSIIVLVILCLLFSGCNTKKNDENIEANEESNNILSEIIPSESTEINLFYDYRIDVKRKCVIAKNGLPIRLAMYEYLDEIPDGESIRFVYRHCKNYKYTFYFFNNEGIQISSLGLGEQYEYPSITVSPDENFFIIEDGLSAIRFVELYKFEGFKKVRQFECLSNNFFYQDYLYLTLLSDEIIDDYSLNERNMYYYVARYSLTNKTIEKIFNYNSLNRYKIKSFNNGEMDVERQYVREVDQWKDPDNATRKTIIKVKIDEDNNYTYK